MTVFVRWRSTVVLGMNQVADLIDKIAIELTVLALQEVILGDITNLKD